MNKLLIGASICALALASSCAPKTETKGSGLDYESMDLTVRPGDNFYQYASGNWLNKNPKPADYANWNAFNVINQRNNERIGSLIQGIAAQQNTPGSLEQKVGDLYNMVMDSVRLNTEGAAPLLPYLQKIQDCKTNAELIAYAAGEHSGILFGVGCGADSKDAKNNIVSVRQGGMTLSNRDYYLSSDPNVSKVLDALKQHIVNLYKLVGVDEETATKKMETIIALETEMAKISFSRIELRVPENNYHKMTVAELNKLTPGYDWDQFFKQYGYEATTELTVGQIAPVQKACELLVKAPVEDLKTLYEWQTINAAGEYLSDAFVTENFNYNTTLNGAATQEARWKRALGIENRMLSFVVGQLYVEKYFPAENKERMLKLVNNLIASFADRIDAQEWMSDSTKLVAKEKLNSFYVKIGYPDKWDDYSPLTIDPAKSLYENALAAQEFRWQLGKEKHYNKPVNKDEWGMTPQTVNASYSSAQNAICFPAGILQPPFFNMEADDAVNYGGIGVVIGHEMTHGFDDRGRQYDKDGNLRQWWNDADVEAFKVPAEQLADYFDTQEVLPGLFTNGHLTLSENIADHGGLNIAFAALQKAMESNPLGIEPSANAPEGTEGFTPEQRFFMSYATIWENCLSEEYIRARNLSDEHSIPYVRVNGALPQIDAWYEAFDIKEGDKMYVAPENRVRIW